jgi:hypothetical protein
MTTKTKTPTATKVLDYLERRADRDLSIATITKGARIAPDKASDALSHGVRQGGRDPRWANVERVGRGKYRYTTPEAAGGAWEAVPDYVIGDATEAGDSLAEMAATAEAAEGMRHAVQTLASTQPPAREWPMTDAPLYEHVTMALVDGREVAVVRDRVGALFAAVPLTSR